MIERLLAADGALTRDELDHAERLFAQVAEADPRNAIAVVGLGRVALRRGDASAARAHLERALEIDPDEAAARRLLADLEGAPAEGAATAIATSALPTAIAATDTAPAPATRLSLLDRIRRWLGIGSRY